MSAETPQHRPNLSPRKGRKIDRKVRSASRAVANHMCGTSIKAYAEREGADFLTKEARETLDSVTTSAYPMIEEAGSRDNLFGTAARAGLLMGALVAERIPYRHWGTKRWMQYELLWQLRSLEANSKDSPYDLEDVLLRNQQMQITASTLELMDSSLTRLYSNESSSISRRVNTLYVGALGAMAQVGVVDLIGQVTAGTISHTDKWLMGRLAAPHDARVLPSNPEEPPTDVSG